MVVKAAPLVVTQEAARACQQRDTRHAIHRTLTVVDSIGIYYRICIEILVARTHCGRTAEEFAIFDRSAVAHVWLRGIHPPAVDAEGIEIVVHLLPEEFACA